MYLVLWVVIGLTFTKLAAVFDAARWSVSDCWSSALFSVFISSSTRWGDSNQVVSGVCADFRGSRDHFTGALSSCTTKQNNTQTIFFSIYINWFVILWTIVIQSGRTFNTNQSLFSKVYNNWYSNISTFSALLNCSFICCSTACIASVKQIVVFGKWFSSF